MPDIKIDAFLDPADPRGAGARARELEAMGCDGICTFEGPHDPFLPLVLAAEHTDKPALYPAIAVAFARNPMSLANLGYDMQMLAGGRFLLGLGSQIRPHIEKRYSMRWGDPVPQMRELVQAVRAIWHCWETDGQLDFRGEYYTHTLMTPFFNPGPHPHGPPKILLAGVGPAMTQMAGEEGDGFLVHPLNSPLSLQELTLPTLARGLKARDLAPGEFQIICQLIVATGYTAEEIRESRAMARMQLAFYGSTPSYRPILDCHGWGELQPRLNALSKAGKWKEMDALVSEEMLDTIVISGTPQEAAAILREQYLPLTPHIAPSLYGGGDRALRELLQLLKE